MKKFLFLGICTLAFLFSGCAATPQTVQTGSSSTMTQSIEDGNVVTPTSDPVQQSSSEIPSNSTTAGQSSASQQGEPASGTSSSSTAAANNTSAPEDPDEYYRVKAEEQAVEIEIERLEAQYRIGEIDSQSFQTQKMELKQQEDALEAQADYLKYYLPRFQPAENWVDSSNLNAMLELMQQLKREEDSVEQQMDELEFSYISSKVSREDFITQMTDLEKQEDQLDAQLDWLEDHMELLGWDD